MSFQNCGVLTLKQVCLQNIADNILSRSEKSCSANKSISIVNVPMNLSQEIFDFCIGKAGNEEINSIISFFTKKPSCTRLQKINLRNARLANVNLIHGLVHANFEVITHLDIRGCRTLPVKFWSILHKASKLVSFKTTYLLTPLRCPNLEILVVDWKPKGIIQKLQQCFHSMYYDKLLENVFVTLKYLDLSWCPWANRLHTLRKAKSLEALILRNCDISNLIDDICQLHGLRTLDISVGLELEMNQDFTGKYSNPDDILCKIVTSLPALEYLDISGTNLSSTTENENNFISILETRRNSPFVFLGLYSTTRNESTQIDNVPAQYITGNSNSQTLMEAIKRNTDMPKTLQNQISKLRTMCGSSLDVNLLLGIQIKMLKNLRADEHFRFWGLKCLCKFLGQIETPVDQISRETLKELFSVLNQLNHSHTKFKKVSESSLRFAFQIFLKLLSVEEIQDNGIQRDVMRLGKFLVSLNRTNFVYFETEAMLFRLLNKLSVEHCVCAFLGDSSVVPSCFEFFKTIQVYLGFSLRIPQTSEIVTITWKSILSFMQASSKATIDFIKYDGLSWMYAHISCYNYDERTKHDLRNIFKNIFNHLETQPVNNKQDKQQTFPCLPQKLMDKVRDDIENHSAI